MNTTVYAPTLAQQAGATRSKRHKAGKYQTPRQKRAFAKYVTVGKDGLSAQELDILSTHPYLLERQRNEFARLAGKSVNWQGKE